MGARFAASGPVTYADQAEIWNAVADARLREHQNTAAYSALRKAAEYRGMIGWRAGVSLKSGHS